MKPSQRNATFQIYAYIFPSMGGSTSSLVRQQCPKSSPSTASGGSSTCLSRYLSRALMLEAIPTRGTASSRYMFPSTADAYSRRSISTSTQGRSARVFGGEHALIAPHCTSRYGASISVVTSAAYGADSSTAAPSYWYVG